jgi:hypothetical protein
MNVLCRGRKDRLGSSYVFSCVYIVADERKLILSLPRLLPSLQRTAAKHAIFATSEFIKDGVRK